MENTKAIYANKFNVTVDENEACLSFYWVMPDIDIEPGQVKGEVVVDAARVTVSRVGIERLSAVLSSLLEKMNNENDQKQE